MTLRRRYRPDCKTVEIAVINLSDKVYSNVFVQVVHLNVDNSFRDLKWLESISRTCLFGTYAS